MSKIIAYLIGLILGIVLFLMINNINKTNCEKQGGVYIFEFGNKGSLCHFKND